MEQSAPNEPKPHPSPHAFHVLPRVHSRFVRYKRQESGRKFKQMLQASYEYSCLKKSLPSHLLPCHWYLGSFHQSLANEKEKQAWRKIWENREKFWDHEIREMIDLSYNKWCAGTHLFQGRYTPLVAEKILRGNDNERLAEVSVNLTT